MARAKTSIEQTLAQVFLTSPIEIAESLLRTAHGIVASRRPVAPLVKKRGSSKPASAPAALSVPSPVPTVPK